jgi:tetratricopeptide (TPR) repeat protein
LSLTTPQAIQWENELATYEERSVARTFTRQFNLLKQESDDIGNLLKVLSFFDLENIPVEMIIDGAKEWQRSQDELQLIPPAKFNILQRIKRWCRRCKKRDTRNKASDVTKVSPPISLGFHSLVILILSPIKLRMAIQSLQHLSLVDYRTDPGNSSLWVHDLIQLMMQDAANKEDTYREWLQSSVSLVCSAIRKVGDPESPQQWDEYERIMPHLQLLNQRTNSLHETNLELIWAIKDIGRYLSCRGRYDEAEVFCKQVFGSCQAELGCEHWNTLSSMVDLAIVYNFQGRYNEAEDLHKRILPARERLMGADHPDTLSSIHNLAIVYDSQGRYGEAEELHKRVLPVSEKVLGADHPRTLASMDNLASVYDSQDRYGEAEELYKRALSGQEKRFGVHHPNTFTMAKNLTQLYRSQGRFSEAKSVSRKYGKHASKLIPD